MLEINCWEIAQFTYIDEFWRRLGKWVGGGNTPVDAPLGDIS